MLHSFSRLSTTPYQDPTFLSDKRITSTSLFLQALTYILPFKKTGHMIQNWDLRNMGAHACACTHIHTKQHTLILQGKCLCPSPMLLPFIFLQNYNINSKAHNIKFII